MLHLHLSELATVQSKASPRSDFCPLFLEASLSLTHHGPHRSHSEYGHTLGLLEIHCIWGPLFGEWEGLHCGGRSALWFPRTRVLLSGVPDSWSVPSTEGCADTKLWKSSAVCVWGAGGRGEGWFRFYS